MITTDLTEPMSSTTLKRLKPYLRPTATEDRPNGSLIVNISKKKRIDRIDDVVQQFSNNPPERLRLSDWTK